MIPYFNAPIYLENKQKIGKLEEILGPINEVFFTVKLDPGMNASSFQEDAKFFIDPMKLLPQSRFLPPPPGSKPPSRGGRGGFAGRGAPRGRGGPSFGGGRGQFPFHTLLTYLFVTMHNVTVRSTISISVLIF
jgi:H/ACA ribonucleoprotein complex subunit 1